MREKEMDHLLGVNTTDLGKRRDQPADYHQHEVTPYWMLAENLHGNLHGDGSHVSLFMRHENRPRITPQST